MTVVEDDVRGEDEGEPPVPVVDHSVGAPTGQLLADMAHELGSLRQATDRYQERAASRERVIDQLSAEVDRLRMGDRRGVLRPLLVDLCRLRDDLLRQAASLPETFTVDQARALLRSFADTVELELETHGVLPYTAEPGGAFDPRRHRRLATVPTDVEAQHGTVAAVERDGYTDQETEKVLLPVGVLLHVFRATAHPSPTSAPDEAGPSVPPPAAEPADPTGLPTDQQEEQR